MHEEELYEPYPPKLLPRRIFLLFHLFTQSRACNLQVQDNDDLIIAKHVFSFSLYVFWKFPSHPFFFLFLLQSYRKRHKRLQSKQFIIEKRKTLQSSRTDNNNRPQNINFVLILRDNEFLHFDDNIYLNLLHFLQVTEYLSNSYNTASSFCNSTCKLVWFLNLNIGRTYWKPQGLNLVMHFNLFHMDQMVQKQYTRGRISVWGLGLWQMERN